jgi:hypothetical protein
LKYDVHNYVPVAICHWLHKYSSPEYFREVHYGQWYLKHLAWSRCLQRPSGLIGLLY